MTLTLMEKIFICYLAAINLVGFSVMGIDKRKARKHKWRIKESTLFILALLLGSVGAWLGMYVFRHKTKRWYFVIGMPAILAVQIIISVYLRLH